MRYPLLVHSLTDKTSINVGISIQTGNLIFTYGDNMVNIPVTVILEYTKTTDTEITTPIGKPYDYSLEERVIGTWYDGRPI